MFSIFARAGSLVLVGLALLLCSAAFVQRSRDVPVTWVPIGRFPKHHVTVWTGRVDPAQFAPCDPPDQRIVAADEPAPAVVASPGLAERLGCRLARQHPGFLWWR